MVIPCTFFPFLGGVKIGDTYGSKFPSPFAKLCGTALLWDGSSRLNSSLGPKAAAYMVYMSCRCLQMDGPIGEVHPLPLRKVSQVSPEFVGRLLTTNVGRPLYTGTAHIPYKHADPFNIIMNIHYRHFIRRFYFFPCKFDLTEQVTTFPICFFNELLLHRSIGDPV